MVYHTKGHITLPSVRVKDNSTIEIELNNFFLKREWKIAIGSLRYLLEELRMNKKILHLVYTCRILKEGSMDELEFIDINRLDPENVYPKILFAKLRADKDRWNAPTCTTLVSW